MQRTHSWTTTSWELSKAYTRRHIYEDTPTPPPPYDDPLDPPPDFFNERLTAPLGPTNPQLLCSRCMLAVLKIYSNRVGTPAFGLFHPPAQACVLCSLLKGIQTSSAQEMMESRNLAIMNVRMPFPTLLARAPPAHIKDVVALWNDTPILMPEMAVDHSTARIVAKRIDVDGVRAIPKLKIDPFVVREWLEDCGKNHGDVCCAGMERSYRSERRILLIDVRHFCLVRKTLPVKYVALSYVWGKAQTYRLKEKDIAPLSALEGLRDIEHLLPQTIMDAITFVQSIEESYLWVDSVCIPQDNPKEMEEQIGHMASIYRSALLTLVVVSGVDAQSAIPGVRPGTRALRSFFETPEVTLAERMTGILPVLLSSHYNTRAWTFQERLLSSRCLYFTSEQAFLQCQTGIYREDRVSCTPFAKIGRDTLALKPLSPALVEASSPGGISGLAKHFMLYRQIVEEYTTKSLSYEADILHAFTGVGEELSPLIQTPITAGLPERFAFRAMLFQPRRTSFTKRTAPMKHIDPRTNELVDLPFPSWSWCGWIGPVEYKNVGSIITCASTIQICSAPAVKSNNKAAEFRTFAETMEPQNPAFAVNSTTTMPKGTAMIDVQPFALRFTASVDVGAHFKLETSVRGSNYLSILHPAGQVTGLVRVDDPNSAVYMEKYKALSRREDKASGGSGLVLLCDIERDLVKQPEEVDASSPHHQRIPWGPKTYYDGRPWSLCAVLYVNWKGGVAERMGVGEVSKEAWGSAGAEGRPVYLV